MKPIEQQMVKSIAAIGCINPEGISRFFVRSFCLSISLSTYRLKAIAALLAKTMHNKTRIASLKLIVLPPVAFNPVRIPIKANGSANMV